MKVYIGPYKNWYGPYQLAETLLFWMDKDEDERVHKFGMWLAGDKEIDEDGNYEHHETLIYKFLRWIDTKKNRTVKVRIDKYDTWSMDSTLALIVLPMLKQLQATKHGSPFVDDEDVPDELKSTSAPPKENEWDTDGNHFKRWDWALNEMIWAFEQLQPDCDWMDQYTSGEHDHKWKKVTKEGSETDMFQMIDGPKHTFKMDHDGIQAHQDRISAGLRLFGKYYQGLWD